ncbi:MAG: hypothetical protein ACI8RZ_006253 [Myxococcota bacterium]|jgi:hypothetical protein
MLLLLACSLTPEAAPPEVQPEPVPAPVIPLGEPKPTEGWVVLTDGMELAVFEAPTPSSLGDSRIRILRVDPAVLTVSLEGRWLRKDDRSLTARQWAEEGDFLAVINAGMFQTDHTTSTHLMVRDGLVNNPDASQDNNILALSPRDPSLPAARIIDRTCEDFPALRQQYQTLVQGIRMLSCTGSNVWSDQPRQWSHALIGQDTDGRLLFIHARSPWRTHDFVAMLQVLPLSLARLQYAEGGPEAQLFVRAGGREVELIGSYETDFYERDDNHRAWLVPNVIAVRATSSR